MSFTELLELSAGFLFGFIARQRKKTSAVSQEKLLKSIESNQGLKTAGEKDKEKIIKPNRSVPKY